MISKVAPKVTKYLGHFCKKICHQELPKFQQIWSHFVTRPLINLEFPNPGNCNYYNLCKVVLL